MHTCTRVRARMGTHSSLLNCPLNRSKERLLCMHAPTHVPIQTPSPGMDSISHSALSSQKCSHFAVGGMKASYQGSLRCRHLPLPTHRSDPAHQTYHAFTQHPLGPCAELRIAGNALHRRAVQPVRCRVRWSVLLSVSAQPLPTRVLVLTLCGGLGTKAPMDHH